MTTSPPGHADPRPAEGGPDRERERLRARASLRPAPPHAAWLIARREIADLLSDWRIVGPALLLVVVLPLLLVVLSVQGRAVLAAQAASVPLSTLVPFALILVGFFPVSFSLMIALEGFVGEKERNTLEALLATPLGDHALYVGKLLAALIPSLVASYTSMAIYLAGVVAVAGYRPAWGLLGALLAVNLGQALIMVASANIISSHTTSVRAANLLAAFIILPTSVLIQACNALIIWGGAGELWLIALALIVFALLLVRMGLRLFNREQILAREMDEVRPGQLLRTFGQMWRLPPREALALRSAPDGRPPGARFSLRRLYLHDIPTLLRLRWPELAMVTLALGVAVGLGWLVGTLHPLNTHGLLAAAGNRGLLAGRVQTLSLVRDVGGGSALPAGLLSVVLRVLLLSGFLIVLAVMTFGTLPVLFMMFAAGASGFLLGELVAAGASPVLVAVLLVLPPVLFPMLALLLLTAFAARFGLAVAAPPPGFGLGESLALALAEFLKIGALALPLLLVAGALQAGLLSLAHLFVP